MEQIGKEAKNRKLREEKVSQKICKEKKYITLRYWSTKMLYNS